MKVIQTDIHEALILEPKVFGDARGFFLESYNKRVLAEAAGIRAEFVQDNHSRSARGVLRGLHYQLQQPQGKLVRVASGTVFDVAVDIRRSSPTFGKVACVELSETSNRMFWLPPGLAHGFLVVSESADFLYKTTDYYAPEHERCILWNDAELAIPWPLTSAPTLSAKDINGVPFAVAELFPVNILLTGRNGQIGWELQRTLLPLGRVAAFGHGELDLADAAAVRRRLDEVRPDVVVNAAAYTAVDKAESEPEQAHAVNAAAPALLAQEAAKRGALLIHYSTDYVFDGSKAAPYVENDPTNPLGAYGRSKQAGEAAIRAAGADHLVFRTSWVYAARGANFLRTILRLAAEREELRVVVDQIGAPTWARLIAEASAHALRQAMQERRSGNFESGLFHLAAAGETSWHGFASAIVAGRSGLRVKTVMPITTAEYPLPAPRPANSRLNTDAFRARFGLELPAWETCLQLCLEEIPQ